MNYYEHHLGDWAEATAHLSFVEDAAYSRLIRKYYATEKPIPKDINAARRLVGARTKDERAAVESVLREFFEERDDGWHQERCDREIARYRERCAQQRAASKLGVEARLRGQPPGTPSGQPSGQPNGAPDGHQAVNGRFTPPYSNPQSPSTNPHTPSPNPLPTQVADATAARVRGRSKSGWRPPTDEELGIAPEPGAAHAP